MKSIQMTFIRLVMFLLFINTSFAQQAQVLTRNDKKLIIEKTISLLHEHYIFPERAIAVQKRITEKLVTNEYDKLNQPELFLETLNKDLEMISGDHHVNIFYNPARVKQIRLDKENEKAGKKDQFTGEWLQKMQYENFRLRKLERLDGNIGYFSFLNFPPLGPSKQSLSSAMNFLLYSSAIVIDLRENGGGYADTKSFMLGYFLKDSTQISELRSRTGETVKLFTMSDKIINKIPDDVPLYILVSNRTSSAAEAFAYTLQQYKRATVIGEQTKGEGNPGSLFVINDDLYMMIPMAEATNPVSKKSIDGIGVIPDITITSEKALSRALLEVNKYLASGTSVRELKLLYQWQIPLLENELEPEAITENIIAALVGEYEGGRKIIYEKATVFYVNTRGEKEKLNYIGKGVFQHAAKSWLRLVMPFVDKPVPTFTWTWNDGGDPQSVKRVSK